MEKCNRILTLRSYVELHETKSIIRLHFAQVWLDSLLFYSHHTVSRKEHPKIDVRDIKQNQLKIKAMSEVFETTLLLSS